VVRGQADYRTLVMVYAPDMLPPLEGAGARPGQGGTGGAVLREQNPAREDDHDGPRRQPAVCKDRFFERVMQATREELEQMQMDLLNYRPELEVINDALDALDAWCWRTAGVRVYPPCKS